MLMLLQFYRDINRSQLNYSICHLQPWLWWRKNTIRQFRIMFITGPLPRPWDPSTWATISWRSSQWTLWAGQKPWTGLICMGGLTFLNAKYRNTLDICHLFVWELVSALFFLYFKAKLMLYFWGNKTLRTFSLNSSKQIGLFRKLFFWRADGRREKFIFLASMCSLRARGIKVLMLLI